MLTSSPISTTQGHQKLTSLPTSFKQYDIVEAIIATIGSCFQQIIICVFRLWTKLHVHLQEFFCVVPPHRLLTLVCSLHLPQGSTQEAETSSREIILASFTPCNIAVLRNQDCQDTEQGRTDTELVRHHM